MLSTVTVVAAVAMHVIAPEGKNALDVHVTVAPAGISTLGGAAVAAAPAQFTHIALAAVDGTVTDTIQECVPRANKVVLVVPQETAAPVGMSAVP